MTDTERTGTADFRSVFDLEVAQTADALIVGAGPVGMFTAFQLGLQGVQAQLCDTLAAMGGQCIELYADKPIYDIPGIPLCTGRELAADLQRQIAPFAPPFHGRTQVAQVQAHGDGRWRVLLQSMDGDAHQWLLVRTIFVTAGVGAFVPKQLRLDGIEPLVGTQVFYHPSVDAPWVEQVLPNANAAHIVVHGGDEAAVQAVVDAAQLPQLAPAKIVLLHRRDQFSAPQALLDALAALRTSGRVQVVIGMPQALQFTKNDSCQSVSGQRMQAMGYIDAEGQDQQLPCSQLWVYQGISPKLGPLLDWGLDIEKKQLQVATDTFATNAAGIYAAGDIVTYSGKRKLILTGFYEATMAAMAAVEYLRGEKLQLEYTTTSKRLHARLGVSHPD